MGAVIRSIRQRAGPATGARGGFVEGHGMAAKGQRVGGGQAGQAGADDVEGPCHRPVTANTAIRNFSARVIRARGRAPDQPRRSMWSRMRR